MNKHKPKRFLGKDTISYHLKWEENPNFEQELQEWKEDGYRWEQDRPQAFYFHFNLVINGEEIKHYQNPHELTRVTQQKDCYSDNYWYPNNDWDSGCKEVVYPDNEHKHSSFEPFTCSCYIAGCAGIGDGVHLKVRGHSVEWRIKKDMGYDFLDKRFYQFDKQEYFTMIEKLEEELNYETSGK